MEKIVQSPRRSPRTWLATKNASQTRYSSRLQPERPARAQPACSWAQVLNMASPKLAHLEELQKEVIITLKNTYLSCTMHCCIYSGPVSLHVVRSRPKSLKNRKCSSPLILQWSVRKLLTLPYIHSHMLPLVANVHFFAWCLQVG